MSHTAGVILVWVELDGEGDADSDEEDAVGVAEGDCERSQADPRRGSLAITLRVGLVRRESMVRRENKRRG